MLFLYLRELRIARRAGSSTLIGGLFFLTVVLILPFGLGADLNLLARVGPTVLWIGVLLASLLGLDRLFQADSEDGSLDLFLIADSRHMLELTVLIKCLAYWTTCILPLVIVTPLLGLFMNVPPSGLASVSLTLLVGTPAITFVGAVGAALTVALPRGSLLVSVLILPLTIPILIFGVAASQGGVTDANLLGAPFLILMALTLFFAVIGPFSAALVFRNLD